MTGSSSPAAEHQPATPAIGLDYANQLLRLLAWPALLVSCCIILAIGFSREAETLYFNLSYAWIIGWLILAERKLGYRGRWQKPDGQLRVDLSHTLLNKGLVQLLIVTLIGAGALDDREPGFAAGYPLMLQILLGLLMAEFGLYWAHRIAHEWPPLWRFHAVHHSVRKLWLVNTGRFHFVDSFASVIASTVFLLLSGISMDAIVWISAITAYIGILTHCNVDMRCGALSYVFNTPQLHRWHHSTDPAIGNNNYGENLMLWDQLFDTFYFKPRAHVQAIGISERMPASFGGQLWAPFVWKRYQAGPVDAAADL
ncbi:MAG: sterol desaturase family protein [Gammaproteobacteria bacterium]